MRRLDAHKKLIGTLAVLLLALPGAAAANDQIAKVQNLGDTLVFFPVVEFRELVLTVTGPCGFEYRQVVDKGEAVFRLDPTTIDGTYTFNLFRNETVDPAIVEILQNARAKLDEETPKALCRQGKMPGPPLVQSASFTVVEGRIIFDERATEKDLTLSDADLPAGANATPASAKDLGIPLKDFVIIDDLIVDGSACIGFDCVNGESFGFDTVRLKENNLRIKFDDTSTAASFPRNDWQLTANDSANGGASKFSIDDISGSRTPFTVEANARSHSLYVDDGGRIGSRTSTPSVEIHTIDGDTPTLRLQQDGSSGFAPQTWDVAGNETNFFVRDVTNGSQLPFRIRPDAPTNSIFIDVDGDVGIGTSSPSERLHLSTTSAVDLGFRLSNSVSDWNFLNEGSSGDFLITEPGTGGAEFRILDGVLAGNSRKFGFGNGPTILMEIQADGDVNSLSGSFGVLSDRNAKTDVVPVDVRGILEQVSSMPISTWRYKMNSDELHMGPMAQDFYAAFGLYEGPTSISLSDLSGVALAAIQGLNQQLTERNQELEARLARLEALVRSLEASQ